MPIAATLDTALLSVSWLNYYRHNRESLMPIPWECGAELNEAELAAVASSIQEFQLGESSEGKHLVRRAEEFAREQGLAAYGEAVKLFVAEEIRHARDLGRVLDLAAVPRLMKGLGGQRLPPPAASGESRNVDPRPDHRRDHRQGLLRSLARSNRFDRAADAVRADHAR